jgi:uncharacterized membrane protein YheB (UPF0754 family)
VQTYLSNKVAKNELLVLDWPAQSPDLSPIENLWHQIKQKLAVLTEKASSKDHLFELVKAEWEKFTHKEIQTLIDSMPNRIQETIAARGGSIGY